MLSEPIVRAYRPFADGRYESGSNWLYVREPGYAVKPHSYIAAFLIIQKDLIELFEYVEPADANLQCYSYRIHSLIMRTCIEVEANCKAILKENGYKGGKLDMRDYRKINESHHLSSYEVQFQNWEGDNVRVPFSAWTEGNRPLPWYDAYHAAKHDRQINFKIANLATLTDAIAGLFVLISSQFGHFEFSLSSTSHIYGQDDDSKLSSGIGDYLLIKFPTDWTEGERYDFRFDEWKARGANFKTFGYS